MPNRRNIYFFYKHDPELVKLIEPLHHVFQKYDFTIVEHPEDANIIVSVGGDGAFLQAIRKTGFREDCLYAGITTDKQTSLYCDFHIEDNADGILHELTTNASEDREIEVRKYPTIEVMLDDHSSFRCLNECSVRSSIIKTFVIDVFVDDLHFETFRGDGLVISTPTGSTAYNKSLNGAVVDPQLPCFQVSEVASLNNNTYRTLGSSFILSGNRILTLKVQQDGNDYPIIGMDNEAIAIRHTKDIRIRLSEKPIKTIKLKNNSYWEKVKRTFL
ncbi:NAD kinase [Priestia taiwanensis]|uniref:NAD kinase n=1 Tax=Priestia taiwanensis TaxID=1347902 RepID=A0A917AX56_9BACI|nr:NAD kinase [Priestia taiwanensis]MBM7363435.1 NAD+ kinase [Priestia taiwanensis]GGE77207.1 NAD kinase 2 [Priestia taiwanensis]